MNPLKTTECSSGTSGQNGERSLHYGDPGRAGGPCGCCVAHSEEETSKAEEDLLPEPQEDGQGRGMQP